MHASVWNQVEHPAVAGHLVNAHLHTGMHGAHQHIHLVALDQAGGVLDALGRVRFVVHLEELDLTPAQLAALLIERHTEAVFDRYTELGKGACVGQHEPHADLVRLGSHDLRQQQAGGSGANHGGTAGKNNSAGGHEILLWVVGRDAIDFRRVDSGWRSRITRT